MLKVETAARCPSQDIPPATHGLWSLWDVLQVFAQDYIQMGGALASMRDHFSLMDKATSLEEIARYTRSFQDDLARILRVCRQLGLSTSAKLIEPRTVNIPKTGGELELLIESIFAELEGKLFTFIPSGRARYYEADDLVSDVVAKAFPKASEEIRAGGTCFAAGQYTACVFHSMRAAEIGLKALGASKNMTIKSGKPLELAEWREILDGLSNVVRDIENMPNATPNKEEELHFYSEASAQFRFFKNGWRVRAAHARATYNEPQALEALDHVRSFFEVLALRLAEQEP